MWALVLKRFCAGSTACLAPCSWFGLEGTLKTDLFQPPYHGKGHLPLEHVVSSFIQPGIKHLLELNVINSFSPVKEKMNDMEFKAALLPQRDEC